MKSFKFNYSPYYWLTVTSLAVLLLLGSLFVCTFWFSDRWEDVFKENIEFLVECSPNAPDSTLQNIENSLSSIEGIKNIRFVSSADAMEVMKKELGEVAFPDSLENPFSASYRFHLNPDLVSKENIETLTQQIKSIRGVDNFYYPEDLYETLRSRIRNISTIFGVIGILLIFLILVMIHHQIRMYIMQHRYHIRTMSLVGATPSYIRKPFIGEVLKMSSFSILVAGIGFLLILLWVGQLTDYPVFRHNFDMVLIGLLFIVALGTIMSFAAAWSAIQRYLESSDARDFI